MAAYNNLTNLYSHKGQVVSLAFGNDYFDYFSKSTKSLFSRSEKVVPVGYEHRPDLIANVFFDDPSLWFIVMSDNGLFDPFESLTQQDRLMLPN